MEVEFSFEDDESAGIWKFVCTCGYMIFDSNSNMAVSNGETIRCPKCDRKYRFIWKGMTVKEIK